MIGLVLATHGPLAEAFVSSGKLIVGNIGNVAHLGLFHGDSIELGGSPCNVTAKAIGRLYKEKKLECFYGINLPIFLEAVTSRKFMNFDELKEHMDEVFKETYGMLSGKISYSACKE